MKYVYVFSIKFKNNYIANNKNAQNVCINWSFSKHITV